MLQNGFKITNYPPPAKYQHIVHKYKLNKSIAAKNSATLRYQNLLKWQKTKTIYVISCSQPSQHNWSYLHNNCKWIML